MTEQHADQVARTKMMNQLQEMGQGYFDIPMSGVCELGVDEKGNNFYVTSVIPNRDGLPNKNEDIFLSLDITDWPMTCGVKLEHLDKPMFNISEMRTHSYIPSQLAYHKHPFFQLTDKIVDWHYDRNLIDGSTDKDQTLKLAQELGELSDSVCKGKDIRDDIGDMLVVMLNITERNGISLDDCLERAWNDIKDRKGKMVDGIFVKESDL